MRKQNNDNLEDAPMTNRFRKTLLSCAITTLASTPLLFGAPSAGAQAVIEEVVVTANRRAENIQDIGLSITALDTAGLERRGITDVSRLGFAVAGLTYATAGNDAKFNLRGANSTNTFADNASIVGAYIDGVYKPHASQQTRAFFDVERLEFLKGPQGTLYGRNTFAGALNLYTNKPTTDGFSSGITTSYERFDTLRMEGFVNLPVNDIVAIRIAGYTEDGDGHVSNSAGPNAGAPDNSGIRLSMAIQASDNLDLVLRYTRIEEKGTTAGLFGYKNICRTVDSQGITDAFGSVRDCQNPSRGSFGAPDGAGDEYRISQDFLPDGDLFENNFTLEINWDAGPVLFKSVSSFTDYENNIPFDFDYSPSPHNIGGFDDHLESISQEFIVSSNYESALQWTAGTYYAKDESFYAFWIYNETVRDDSGRPVATTPFGDYTIFDGTPLVSQATSLGGPFADSHAIESIAKAVFFQAEYSVTDQLRLIAGVRASDEEKKAFGGGSNFTANGPVTQLFATGGSPAIIPTKRTDAFAYSLSAAGANSVSKDYDNTTWKAGIEYDFSDDIMLYATASTGFLSGALNNNGTGTDEQESEMFEVGLKSILLDGSLLLNLAAHSTEYTNLLAQLQTNFVDPDGNVVVLTTTRNGGQIEATGLELEIQYYPNANLFLGFTAALLDAEFGEYGQTSPYQLNRGVPTVYESVKGETPGWSPDLVYNFIAEYEMDLGAKGTLTPSLMFAYSDEYNTSNLYILDPNHQQDSYTKTDVRLTWRPQGDRYEVSAYIENMEDEAVKSRGNNGSQDNVQTGFLYPRNYGLRVKINLD
jgi:outer membrane receptor protein involved in Fe transport